MNPNHAHFATRILDHIRGKGWVPVVELRRALKWGSDNAHGVPSLLTIINSLKRDGSIEDSRQWPSQGDVGKGYAIKIAGEVAG